MYDYQFEYNKDWVKRDEIIFGIASQSGYYGGVKHFGEMDYDTLKKLYELKYIDPDECQNDSPNTSDYMAFLEKYPAFTVHGYVVAIDRDDYRITIEGCDGSAYNSEDITIEMIKDFVEYFRYADDFNIDGLYCWYD